MLLQNMFVKPENLPSEYELEYTHNQLERACDGTWYELQSDIMLLDDECELADVASG